jgi:TIR domain
MSDQLLFDVFLAHNSQDKDLVNTVAASLENNGLKPWLDKDQILGGDLILDEIESAISRSKCAAFFIGQNGLGPWHRSEMRSLIEQSIDNGFRVIPVLLPGITADILKTKDFLFLRQRLCIEWKSLSEYDSFLDQFSKSIRGKKFSHGEDQVSSEPRNEIDEARQLLESLTTKKFALEKKLEEVKNKITEVEMSLMDDIDAGTRILINRLSKVEKLSKRHVLKVLKQKKFEDLKLEIEQKDNLERVCLEVKTYVERLRMSFQRGNTHILRNPRLAPTLSDSGIYQSACFEIYISILHSIKDDISDDLDSHIVEKMENHLEFFLARLSTIF